MDVITLNTKDIIVFIVARDKPKNVKLTSLQLIVFFCNSLRRLSLVKLLISLFESQTRDSLKNPVLCQNDKTILRLHL